MQARIKTAREFDVDKVSFGAVKVLDTGGRLVYISYDGEPLIVQTPEMYAPFGISSFSNDASDPSSAVKYSMDIAFKNVASRASERCFLKKLKTFDELVISTAFDSAMAWLKKKFPSLEVIEALYTHSIKVPKDKDTGDVTDKYPQTFKMKIPSSKDGKFMCEAYDVDGTPLDVAALVKDGSVKGASVTAIMRCSGIWIAGGKFGCTWSAMQIRVKRGTALPPCAFANDEDDDHNNDCTKVADSDSDEDVDHNNDCTKVADSDSDEDVDNDEQQHVPATPAAAAVMDESIVANTTMDEEDVGLKKEEDDESAAAVQSSAATTTPTKKRVTTQKKK